MSEAGSRLELISRIARGAFLSIGRKEERKKLVEPDLQLKKDLLVKIFSLTPQDTLVTGSVAQIYQQGLLRGLLPEEALENALVGVGDIDVLVRQNNLDDVTVRELRNQQANYPGMVDLSIGENRFSAEELERSEVVKLGKQDIRLMHASDILADNIRIIESILGQRTVRMEDWSIIIKRAARTREICEQDWKGRVSSDLLQKAKQLIEKTESLRKSL